LSTIMWGGFEPRTETPSSPAIPSDRRRLVARRDGGADRGDAGRPELRDDAQSTFRSPDASADLVEQVRLYQAVDDAIGRCPLDERTATTLHRPVTMPGVSRSGPRFDPAALAPVLIMFGGLGLALALLVTWR
jgi:hypothetical protein